MIAILVPAVAAVQEGNQAGLVVRFGDERVETYCVSFDEQTITGYELLQRSDLALEVAEMGMGVSVCRVEELGCSANNCFCQCRGGVCEYWSYWQLNGGQWQYAVTGASLTDVQHGEVQGWSWGPGSVNEAIAPPPMTFEEVCAVETAAVEATATGGTAIGDVVAVTSTPPGTKTAAQATTDGERNGQTALPASYAFYGLLIVLLGALAVAAYRRRQP